MSNKSISILCVFMFLVGGISGSAITTYCNNSTEEKEVVEEVSTVSDNSTEPIAVESLVPELDDETTEDVVAEDPYIVEDESSDSVTTETLELPEGTKDVHEVTVDLESGESLTYYIPDEHYYLTDNYLASVKASYNAANDLESPGLIVTGNEPSVYGSSEAINATPISGIKVLMQGLYGDDVEIGDLAYSEAYTYMTTGEIPETEALNYTIDEVATVEKDGITYKAYHVSYDIDYSGTGDENSIVHNEQLMCYSDTEDPMEIIIYTGDYDEERSLELLHTFLGE